MFAQSLLLALAAATAVTANHHAPLHPGHLAAKRELSARQTQTDDDTSAATSCLDGLMSIYSTLPTAPPEIVSWEEANTITDPCSISIPASISSAFSAYETAAVSWYSAHSSDLFAALSQCPELSSIAGGAGPDDTPSLCTGAAGGAATGSPAQTTGGGDDATTSTGAAAAQTTTDAAGNASTTTTKAAGTTTDAAGKVSTITTKAAGTTTKAAGTGSAASSAGAASTKSTNAGPRETAFVGAAVAAAGFLGVIAAL